MIRARLTPDSARVRLDVTDAVGPLLDVLAVAFAADPDAVGEALLALAAAADRHGATATNPRATDYARDDACAADAARADVGTETRRVLTDRRADLLAELPDPPGLLSADLSYRAALALARELLTAAARTPIGRTLAAPAQNRTDRR